MTTVASTTPQWLQDLRDRRKLLREENRTISSWIQSPISPKGNEMLIVESGNQTKNCSNCISELECADEDCFESFDTKVSVSNSADDIVQGFVETCIAKPVTNGYADSSQTEINLEYVQASDALTRNSSVTGENEESYCPGFVRKLLKKWTRKVEDVRTRRLSDDATEYSSKKHMQLAFVPIPVESEKVSTDSSKNYSFVNDKNQTNVKVIKKANSLETLLDSTENTLLTNNYSVSQKLDKSSSTNSVDAVGSKEKPWDNLSSIRDMSQSTPTINDHNFLKPVEPEHLNSDDELPRPNTVLAALSIFETPGGKKKSWKSQISTKSTTVISNDSKHKSGFEHENMKVDAKAEPVSKPVQFKNRFVKTAETTDESSPKLSADSSSTPDSISTSLPKPKNTAIKKIATPKKPPCDFQKAHVVFDFRNDDPDGVRRPVVRSRKGAGSRPTSMQINQTNDSTATGRDSLKLDLSNWDEPNENDTSWMDMNPQPCTIYFVGADVKSGKSSLKKQASAKTGRVQFCSASPSEFEYQSEESLLQELGIVHESTLLEIQEQKRELARLREQRAQLKLAAPGGGVTAGELGSYRTKQSLDYQFGQHLAEERELDKSHSAQVPEPSTDDVTVTPAAEEDHVTWSGNATSDILF